MSRRPLKTWQTKRKTLAMRAIIPFTRSETEIYGGVFPPTWVPLAESEWTLDMVFKPWCRQHHETWRRVTPENYVFERFWLSLKIFFIKTTDSKTHFSHRRVRSRELECRPFVYTVWLPVLSSQGIPVCVNTCASASICVSGGFPPVYFVLFWTACLVLSYFIIAP